MTHDLRQTIGFRRLPSSDPVEQDLRDQWYSAKERADGKETTSPEMQHFIFIDGKLRTYLWDRASAIVAADRAKHPKARRNQGKPTTGTENNRYLP